MLLADQSKFNFPAFSPVRPIAVAVLPLLIFKLPSPPKSMLPSAFPTRQKISSLFMACQRTLGLRSASCSFYSLSLTFE